MQNDKLLRVLDETRNITHAADRLYITQPALSRRIKSIGHVLGAELLLRPGRASASPRQGRRPCAFAGGGPFVRRTYIMFPQEALRLPQAAARSRSPSRKE